MSDPIERQEALDICAKAIDLWHGQLGEGALIAVKDGIAALPPAQLEYMCFGYNLRELIIFADACTRQGIRSDEMHAFVLNVDAAVHYVRDEFARAMDAAMTINTPICTKEEAKDGIAEETEA